MPGSKAGGQKRERNKQGASRYAQSAGGEGHHEMDAPVRRALRTRLLRWYDLHRRDLPWRRRQNNPYAQLLAEFMLQQTQVATVIDYYERFIHRFPTVDDLAAADLDEVLRLWAGLGYYRRARNLHAAAREIVTNWGGRVPSSVDQLMSLPGIGRYTAGAIASVAFGTRAPVLDGNVTRVLTRLLAIEEDSKSPSVVARLWRTAESLLPEDGCGEFNQAMMELGALVCTPHAPSCAACPLSPHCRALHQQLIERIPVIARKRPAKGISIVVAAMTDGDRILLVQAPHDGLWGGLWELPSELVGDGESTGDGVASFGETAWPGLAAGARSGDADCAAAYPSASHFSRLPGRQQRKRACRRSSWGARAMGEDARTQGTRCESRSSSDYRVDWSSIPVGSRGVNPGGALFRARCDSSSASIFQDPHSRS